MTGPRPCTAVRPGACSTSIGSGGTGGPGSALATPVTPPNSSVTDEPIATAAVANIVLVDMTPPVSLVVVFMVDVATAVRAVPTAGS